MAVLTGPVISGPTVFLCIPVHIGTAESGAARTDPQAHISAEVEMITGPQIEPPTGPETMQARRGKMEENEAAHLGEVKANLGEHEASELAQWQDGPHQDEAAIRKQPTPPRVL